MTTTRWIARRMMLPLLAASLAACKDQLPTSVDPKLLPVGPVSIEVRLPWSQFASSAKVFEGYGHATDGSGGFISNKYEGVVDSHLLYHFAAFPTSADVADSLGTTVTDDSLHVVGATFKLHLRSAAGSNGGPVVIGAARTLTHWDAQTASWDFAVDSAGSRQAWGEPGGGPVEPIGLTAWNPEVDGDSAVFVLDSAAVAGLVDTTLAERGVRITMETVGEQALGLALEVLLEVRPSVNPDTTVFLASQLPTDFTFVYNPKPQPNTTGLRIGGIPSARTVISLALPETVPGNAEVCAVTTCPLELTGSRLNHATLVLTTRPSEKGFRPPDSLRIQAVEVLAPDVLPKSPLGPSIFISASGLATGAQVGGAAFVPGGSRRVEVPITPIVENLFNGATPTGETPSSTVALLSYRCIEEAGICREPASIGFGSFAGVGEPGEPYLRLILTISDAVGLP